MRGKKIISLLLAGSMAVASAVCLLPDQARDVLASDSVVCDGNSADWGSIASRGSADGSVSDWKTCVSGSYLYLYAVQNPTGAYGEAIGNTKVSLTYNDSQLYNANYSTIQFVQDWSDGSGSYVVKDGWNNNISGAQLVFEGGNTDYNVDSAFAEVAIPRSWFPSEDFTLTYAGVSVSGSDIATIDGASVLEKQKEETGYGNGNSSEASTEETVETIDENEEDTTEDANADLAVTTANGITIDGNFSDWNNVQKTQNPASALKEGAAVWIGDYVYLYLREQDWWDGCATQVGPWNNGTYCIELSDGTKTNIMIGNAVAYVRSGKELRELDFRYSNHEYEIAVPVSSLQGFNDKITSLNFGIMTDTTPIYITQGCVNQSPGIDTDDTTTGTLKKISYDYDFSDWEGYQKTSIGYNTKADASGALYSDGDILFGYVDYYGAYYRDAFNFITLSVNGQNSRNTMYFTLRGVDANGNVQQWKDATNLGPGDYEFYLFDTAYVGSASNINDPWTYTYGRAYIHVDKTGRAQMEYYIDIPTLVEVVNKAPEQWGAYDWNLKQSDMKTFHVNYVRIGPQWISCGGTSTGPILGILLCLAVVVIAQVYRKKRTGRLA